MKKGNGKRASKRTTIYERIGGEPAIRAAIDGLYARILGDVILTPFFVGADTERIKDQQVVFFSQALGGPARYRGPAMKPPARQHED
jgi:hemoglobin